jgi:hypothetical protein
MESVLYDAAGHRRSPATMPGYHEGRPPRNKGLRYPADPPTVEEIVAVMRAAGDGGCSWRAGVRAARDRSHRSRGFRSSGRGLRGGEGLLGGSDEAGDQLGATCGLGGEVDLVELCVKDGDVYDVRPAVVLRGR